MFRASKFLAPAQIEAEIDVLVSRLDSKAMAECCAFVLAVDCIGRARVAWIPADIVPKWFGDGPEYRPDSYSLYVLVASKR